jgi:hypothetical protein
MDVPALSLQAEIEKLVPSLKALTSLLFGLDMNRRFTVFHQLANQTVNNQLKIVCGMLVSLAPKQQYELLLIQNREDFNLLMWALKNQPAAVDGILQAVDRLPAADQSSVLKQMLMAKDEFGNNALMLACKDHPVAVKTILQAVGNLPEEEQAAVLKEILTVQDKITKSNLLMWALENQPAAVDGIRQAVDRLPAADQSSILTEMLRAKDNLRGQNVLMLALENQPAAVDWILGAAQKVSILTEMLRAKDKFQNTILALARSSRASVESILAAVEKLPDLERASVLKEMLTSKEMYYNTINVLMSSVVANLPTVDLILKAVDRLPEAQRASVLKEMLMAKDTKGNSWLEEELFGYLDDDPMSCYSNHTHALMLAVVKNLAAVDLILQAVDRLSKAERASFLKEMLTVKDRNGNNLLMLASQCQPAAVDLIRAALEKASVEMPSSETDPLSGLSVLTNSRKKSGGREFDSFSPGSGGAK